MRNVPFVLLALLALFPLTARAVNVALTIDDLPAAGDEVPGHSRAEIAKQIISSLQGHHVRDAYGFVTGILAKDMEERLKILEAWKQAGFEVGNHGYSHKDLAQVSAADYIEDIEKNESILLDYAKSIDELKVFRYPYLSEGETSGKRYAVRSYFARRGYKIAPVTVDFLDWAFNPTYIRCVSRGDQKGLSRLENLYLDRALSQLKTARGLARRMYGREVDHILLLHLNGLTSRMLTRLLEAYQKEGTEFVSLKRALADPIYAEDTVYFNSVGATFLFQARDSRKLVLPEYTSLPAPVDELAKICQ